MNLLIVGAGSFGREIFSWISHDLKYKRNIKITGFLDDNLKCLDNYNYSTKIIGTISEYIPNKNESLVIAVMDPLIKKRIINDLLVKKANFYTFVHSSAIIGQNVKIGEGSIIAPNCTLSCDISIGNFVLLNGASGIGHDVKIGDYTSTCGKVEITGNVTIGKECLLGVGAKIIPQKKIGDNAIVGAGSVVINDVETNTTVFGNPAKIIFRQKM